MKNKGNKVLVVNYRDRKRNRLKDFDYSQNGCYFVTICTKNREEFFGEVKNNEMVLNEIGKIIEKCWLEIPNHFPDAILDEFIIMPNYIHGIVVIKNNVGNKNFCSVGNVGNKNFCSLHFCSLHFEMPWQTKLSRSLSSIIRGFKIGAIKWCRENNQNDFQWQKSFYDHIIRNEKSLNSIREYIRHNPLKWATDRNNQENLYY